MAKKTIYHSNEKCSYKIASDLLCLSERSAARYIATLRRSLGFNNGSFISVGRFCDFYGIDRNILLD